MTPEDRLRAAERLLGDPLAMALLDEIESTGIEAMLEAPNDEARRQCRDTVKTIRGLRDSLRNVIAAHKAAAKDISGYA